MNNQQQHDRNKLLYIFITINNRFSNKQLINMIRINYYKQHNVDDLLCKHNHNKS